jgi:hypothetical protein
MGTARGLSPCARVMLRVVQCPDSGARSIFLQSTQTESQDALTPKLDRCSRNLLHLGNILGTHSVGSHLDDSCTLDYDFPSPLSKMKEKGKKKCREETNPNPT